MAVRVSTRVDRTEARHLVAMAAAIVVLHVVGWGTLLIAAAQDFNIGTAGVFGVGLGITAYTLGMRHAFDADHIAAIDNVTRKLLADRHERARRPMSVGFWFSLGHSSIVFCLCLLLAVGVRSLGSQVERRVVRAAADDRPHRAQRVVDLPDPHRRDQRGRPRRHPEGLPGDAQRALRRGTAWRTTCRIAG